MVNVVSASPPSSSRTVSVTSASPVEARRGLEGDRALCVGRDVGFVDTADQVRIGSHLRRDRKDLVLLVQTTPGAEAGHGDVGGRGVLRYPLIEDRIDRGVIVVWQDVNRNDRLVKLIVLGLIEIVIEAAIDKPYNHVDIATLVINRLVPKIRRGTTDRKNSATKIEDVLGTEGGNLQPHRLGGCVVARDATHSNILGDAIFAGRLVPYLVVLGRSATEHLPRLERFARECDVAERQQGTGTATTAVEAFRRERGMAKERAGNPRGELLQPVIVSHHEPSLRAETNLLPTRSQPPSSSPIPSLNPVKGRGFQSPWHSHVLHAQAARPPHCVQKILPSRLHCSFSASKAAHSPKRTGVFSITRPPNGSKYILICNWATASRDG